MKPRDYQQKFLNDIKRGEKNLVHLATGGGKSVIFLNYIIDCLNNNRPVLFIVYGNSILDQAVKKYFSDFDVTKMQGSNKWRMSKILACSISTFARKSKEQKKELYKYYKDIVVDEAHNATSDSYQNSLPAKENSDYTVVGLTATPYAIGKKGHTYWTNYIKHVSVRELVKLGWLVKPRCFAAEIKMDTNVPKLAKDFNQKQLFEKNDNMVIYSSITDEYLKYGENKQALCFGVNLVHSKNIAEQFNKIGIKAVHADADTPLDERERIINQFKNKEIQILCNVNIFSTGVDIPITTVGIMARPTKSRVLWIQQVGRMLRPHPDKPHAIILDHGGNIKRCGHPLEDFEAVLVDGEGDKDPAIKVYECPACFFVYSEKSEKCPACGFENTPLKEAKEREIKRQEEAKLKEIKFKDREELQETYNQPWRRMKDWYFSKELASHVHIEKNDYAVSDLASLSPEAQDIFHIIQKAYHRKHKPNSVYFKIYEIYPETEYLKFPKWFIKIKENEKESLQKTSESNSNGITTSSTDFSTRKVFR